MGLHAPFDVPHTRIYANNSLSALSVRETLGRETYGLTPHVTLIGLTDSRPANSRLIWQSFAGGGRIVTIYAAGDGYGATLMNNDFTLTDAGKTLGPILAPIMENKEILLATRDDIFTQYTEAGFVEAFSQSYRLLKRIPIEGTLRTLFLFEALA